MNSDRIASNLLFENGYKELRGTFFRVELLSFRQIVLGVSSAEYLPSEIDVGEKNVVQNLKMLERCGSGVIALFGNVSG
jgi:hypothetical protein